MQRIKNLLAVFMIFFSIGLYNAAQGMEFLLQAVQEEMAKQDVNQTEIVIVQKKEQKKFDGQCKKCPYRAPQRNAAYVHRQHHAALKRDSLIKMHCCKCGYLAQDDQRYDAHVNGCNGKAK